MNKHFILLLVAILTFTASTQNVHIFTFNIPNYFDFLHFIGEVIKANVTSIFKVYIRECFVGSDGDLYMYKSLSEFAIFPEKELQSINIYLELASSDDTTTIANLKNTFKDVAYAEKKYDLKFPKEELADYIVTKEDLKDYLKKILNDPQSYFELGFEINLDTLKKFFAFLLKMPTLIDRVIILDTGDEDRKMMFLTPLEIHKDYLKQLPNEFKLILFSVELGYYYPARLNSVYETLAQYIDNDRIQDTPRLVKKLGYVPLMSFVPRLEELAGNNHIAFPLELKEAIYQSLAEYLKKHFDIHTDIITLFHSDIFNELPKKYDIPLVETLNGLIKETGIAKREVLSNIDFSGRKKPENQANNKPFVTATITINKPNSNLSTHLVISTCVLGCLALLALITMVYKKNTVDEDPEESVDSMTFEMSE